LISSRVARLEFVLQVLVYGYWVVTLRYSCSVLACFLQRIKR